MWKGYRTFSLFPLQFFFSSFFIIICALYFSIFFFFAKFIKPIAVTLIVLCFQQRPFLHTGGGYIVSLPKSFSWDFAKIAMQMSWGNSDCRLPLSCLVAMENLLNLHHNRHSECLVLAAIHWHFGHSTVTFLSASLVTWEIEIHCTNSEHMYRKNTEIIRDLESP